MFRFLLLLAFAIPMMSGCGGSGAPNSGPPRSDTRNYAGDYTGTYTTPAGVLLGTVVGYVAEPDQVAIDTTSAATGYVMQWRGTLNESGAYNGTVSSSAGTYPATGVFSRGSGTEVHATMQYHVSGAGQTTYFVFRMNRAE